MLKIVWYEKYLIVLRFVRVVNCLILFLYRSVWDLCCMYDVVIELYFWLIKYSFILNNISIEIIGYGLILRSLVIYDCIGKFLDCWNKRNGNIVVFKK